MESLMGRDALPFWPRSAKLAWWLRRLHMMSAGEVLWRARTRGMLEIWRRQWSPPPPPRLGAPDPYRTPVSLPSADTRAVVEAGRSLLDGTYTALGCTFELDPVEWHLDPQSGVTAPLAFGPLMNYRDPELVGNVRNIWEFNRHQHLTVAAAAYALSRDERLAVFVRRQIEAWILQNPYPLGVNWASPLELGLRLLSWVWVSRLLTGSPEREALFGTHGCLWPGIYRHQWLIARLRSRGSSANNHLIGEMCGLYVSATVWPVFEQSSKWSGLARRSLHREIDRQYYASGLNKEQAYGYHLFSTEFLALAALESDRYGSPFSSDYLRGLRRAVSAALALPAPGGVKPNFGDSDDAVALDLGSPRRALGWLPAVAAAWLGEPSFHPEQPAAARDSAAFLLSGVRPQDQPSEGIEEKPPTRAYHDAGLFVMTSTCNGEEAICLADAGEIGYLSIAAHGHADALSFTLAVGDEALLVDPGTFSYHYDPEARAYFRGTRAHNTITIDGENQSQSGGPFLWTRKADATVHGWHQTEREAVLMASHDGYERLADPVTHWRRLVLDAGHLTVDDELAGTGVHDVEWRLHLAPGCEAHLDGHSCDILGRRHRLSLQLDTSLRWELLVGEANGGWYSCSFNQRQETTTLVGSARLALPRHLRHVLTLH
jgi:Heparinase II/III-like protein/Heparinase II/III N-terminus